MFLIRQGEDQTIQDYESISNEVPSLLISFIVDWTCGCNFDACSDDNSIKSWIKFWTRTSTSSPT